MPTPPNAIYETVLYAADPEAAGAFYRDVIGLAPIDGLGHLGAGFRLGAGVLLIFDPEQSDHAGRPVPAHGARGAGHVAFSVADREAWRARLAEHGVEIELERGWPTGGQSLYVRDPAGNSVELVEGEIWPSGRST